MSKPSFVDFDYCRQFITGKSVVIVGSGPAAVLNETGFIDSHDVVIRVNNYGRHRNLGTRTDVFYSFFGGSIKKTRDELIADGVKLCMCKCPDAKPLESAWHERHGRQHGIDFRYIYEARRQFWFGPTYIPTVQSFLEGVTRLERHIPTTGFAAIDAVLQCLPKSLYLTGFDFFTSGIHNVDQRWRPGDPGDPIGHVPELEAKLLAETVRLKLPFKITTDRALARCLENARMAYNDEGVE